MRPLSKRLQRDEAQTVEAVIQVASSSICAELSNLAAKQGISVRDYALLPFGGAGPLLAPPVAEELGINRIVIPAAPGTLCSLGALLSDVSKPFVQSIVLPLREAANALVVALRDLQSKAKIWIESEAPGLIAQRFEVAADMRYLGQSYEIDVAVEPRWIEAEALDEISNAFHRRHRTMFAHADELAPVEIVDLRLTVVGITDKPPSPDVHDRESASADSPRFRSERSIVVGSRFRIVPVYQRRDLPTNVRFEGPAIIEQDDTTVYLAPEWFVAVHASGTLIMEKVQS